MYIPTACTKNIVSGLLFLDCCVCGKIMKTGHIVVMSTLQDLVYLWERCGQYK